MVVNTDFFHQDGVDIGLSLPRLNKNCLKVTLLLKNMLGHE